MSEQQIGSPEANRNSILKAIKFLQQPPVVSEDLTAAPTEDSTDADLDAFLKTKPNTPEPDKK